MNDKDTYRMHTKVIQIGDRKIGGGNPIAIQSMTNTKTEDVKATVEQILRLEKAGCEIIRCTVPTLEAAAAIREIKKQIHIPLVADIHFDYRMALAAIENGADKIRINPGNIGSTERVKAVVDAAKERNIPIRVGVNSGSLEKPLIEKYGGVTAEGIVESALDKVHMIEDLGYDNLVISIKSSDVLMCVKAHELLAGKTVYPLHVGITESGTVNSGNIKSAIGLSLILSQGIGDTIRVSLTGDPVEEIKSAKLILRTLGLRKGGIEVVSCPTCGRTQINLIDLATRVEKLVEDYPLDIKVAVMGCVVNGPGEAKEADLGVAGGIGEGLLIKHGEIIKKLPEDQLLPALKEEFTNYITFTALPQFFKVVQWIQTDFAVLTTHYFCNFQHFSAFIPNSPQMHNNIHAGCYLVADRRKRQIHSHEYHILQSRQHIGRAVCMSCRHTAVMPGIHTLQHINSFRASHFAYNDPVGPHPQR